MQPGDQIAATKDTPALLATALKSHQTVVVSFLMPGSADDRLVGDAVAGVRKTPLAKRGVRFITYQLGRSPKDMGMAAELLGVAGTPSVAVIDPQGKLQTRFLGVIDQSMVTQAIADTNPPGPGPKKKIAKKVGKKVGAKTPAKSTPKAPPAGTKATPAVGKPKPAIGASALTGNPKGVALAKQVNAAYASVAGLAEDRTSSAGGTLTRLFATTGGKVTGVREIEVAGAVTTRKISRPEALYTKSGTATCWTKGAPQPSDFGEILSQGVTSAPNVAGAVTTFSLTSNGSAARFKIDSKTKMLASATYATAAGKPSATSTFRLLSPAPVIDAPTPLCP